jgi:alkaline phosphatase D
VPRASLSLSLSLILSIASSEASAISSTFDVDTEGWFVENRLANDGFSLQGTQAATHQTTGGNPGGHICCADTTGFSDFFAAPALYVGDKSSFIGGTLSFDAKSDSAPQFSGQFLVLLEGNGVTLFFDSTSPFPQMQATWESLSVSLAPEPGWKVATGNCFFTETCVPADNSDFQLVMSNLTSLNIRGDWVDGGDIGRLDNVNMVPEPATLLLLAGGLLALSLRRPLHADGR